MNAYNTDALNDARVKQIKQAEEQRRLRHLHRILGVDAATQLNRLRLAKRTSLLTGLLGGALFGGTLGYLGAYDPDNRGATAVRGALQGAAALGALGLTSSVVGGIAGRVSKEPRAALRSRLADINMLDYVLPGRATYLDEQLEKDFLENESMRERPQQLVY